MGLSTAALRPSTSAAISLGNPALRFSAAHVSSGIGFPAAQNNSADANTLDDYEEGTFTPTLNAATTDFGAVAYAAVRSGLYTKIGRAVEFEITMKTTAVTTTGAAGQVSIGGLPFAAAGTSNQFIAVNVGYCAAWAANTPLHGLLVGNDTKINLYTRTASTGADTGVLGASVAGGNNANEMYIGATYASTT